MSNKYKRFGWALLFVITLIAFSAASSHAIQIEWEVVYNITSGTDEGNTGFFVDIEASNVDIDHANKEIRIPRDVLESAITFRNAEHEMFAYSIMTREGIRQYLFDGNRIVEVDSLRIPINNPVSLTAHRSSVDIIIATNDSSPSIFHYMFDGTGMVTAPSLVIGGYQAIRSVAILEDSMIAVLDDTEKVSFNIMDGMGYMQIPGLEITGLNNPLAIASSGDYHIVVMEKNRIRQFTLNDGNFSEVPSLAISLDASGNTINPRAVAAAEGKIAFIDKTGVHTYLQSETTMVRVDALSVTDSLEHPMAVALHPNSNDIIVLDHDLANRKAVLRYFMFDGSGMVEVPSLNTDFADMLLNGNIYLEEGYLVTNDFVLEARHVRNTHVGVYADVPDQTSVLVSIQTSLATGWHPLWKVTGSINGPVVEKNVSSAFGGASWIHYGGIESLYPRNYLDAFGSFQTTTPYPEDYSVVLGPGGAIYLDLIRTANVPVPSNFGDPAQLATVSFKFNLSTRDTSKSPKLFVPEGNNSIPGINDHRSVHAFSIGAPPAPVIKGIQDGFVSCPGEQTSRPGWVYTTTPIIEWDTAGTEAYFLPSHYEVVIMGERDGGWVTAFSRKHELNSMGPQLFRVPDASSALAEGVFFSAGTYKFATFIRIFDLHGNSTEFSEGLPFNVLAFDRPRVSNIVMQPNNQPLEDGFLITQGTTVGSLPKAKAGTAITFELDSVGPIDLFSETIFYAFEGADVPVLMRDRTSVAPAGSSVNRLTYVFWTPASSTEIDLQSTLIKGVFSGESLVGGQTNFCLPNFADGIVEITDTVYQDWMVVIESTRD